MGWDGGNTLKFLFSCFRFGRTTLLAGFAFVILCLMQTWMNGLNGQMECKCGTLWYGMVWYHKGRARARTEGKSTVGRISLFIIIIIIIIVIPPPVLVRVSVRVLLVFM